MAVSKREPGSPLRVVIADHDPRVRRGLRALLEAQPGVAVVAEADSAGQALRYAADLHPSVLLLDLQLPTTEAGLAALQVLAEQRQPCVVTSWHGGLRNAALRLGATCFVEKGAAPERVLAAVREAYTIGYSAASLTAPSSPGKAT